jgi:hypothetical protein
MTPLLGWEVTLGEKPPSVAGDEISRKLVPAKDFIRLEWQPDRRCTKQHNKIDVNRLAMVLQFMLRVLRNNGLPWQPCLSMGIDAKRLPRHALPSVMKPVANLDNNFARI